MASGTTLFPVAKDDNAVATNITEISSGGFNDHSVQIEAIQTKVGVDSSAVDTTVDYFLKHASGAYRTHIHDGSSDDGAVFPDGSIDQDKINNPYCASAYLGTAQLNLTHDASVLVLLDTEKYDYNSNFSTVTSLYTAPVTGVYSFKATVAFNNVIASSRYYIVFKDNTTAQYGISSTNSGTGTTAIYLTSAVDILLTAGQTVGIYCTAETAADQDTVDLSINFTHMTVHLVHKVLT